MQHLERIPPKYSIVAQNLQDLVDNLGFEQIIDLVDCYYVQLGFAEFELDDGERLFWS